MPNHRSVPPATSTLSYDLNSLPESVNADERSNRDLARRADAVAHGQVPFPEDLDDDEAERLRLEVVRIRRRRLVTFIARAISRDMRDGFQESTRR